MSKGLRAALLVGLALGASGPAPAQERNDVRNDVRNDAAEVARLRAEVARLQQELREQRELIIKAMQLDQQHYDLLLKLIQGGGGAASATPPPALPHATAPTLPPGRPPGEINPNETGTISGRVESSGALGEAYVYIDGLKAPAVHHTLEIKQRDKRFVPAVQVVQVGTRVLFPNFDTVIHNVFSNSAGNAFDLGTVKGGDNPSPVVLLKPGPVEIFCNIHARMRADLLVVTNPHWTKVAPDGSFQLTGVPAGPRRVALWGPNLAPASQRVDLTARGATITLTAAPAPPRPHLNKNGQPYGQYAD